MPSQTFENLPQSKQALVRQALLEEFSNHDLADAQVARIVKNAQRGGPFIGILLT